MALHIFRKVKRTLFREAEYLGSEASIGNLRSLLGSPKSESGLADGCWGVSSNGSPWGEKRLGSSVCWVPPAVSPPPSNGVQRAACLLVPLLGPFP